MPIPLSVRARLASDEIVKEPALVLEIDGVSTKYGSGIILEVIRIGDVDLLIDGTWVIGGFRAIQDQSDVLNLDKSTTQIKQQLEIDKGRGSSISSMEIGLVDFGEEITKLITPGEVVTDILGRRARVSVGYRDRTSFPEDFSVIFRGVIDDVKSEAGIIKLNIAHPDAKKKSGIYDKVETALATTSFTVFSVVSNQVFSVPVADGPRLVLGFQIRYSNQTREIAIIAGNQITLDSPLPFTPVIGQTFEMLGLNAIDTSITLQDASQLTVPVLGPDLALDPSFKAYVRINNELIEYTGKTGNTITGCVRGSDIGTFESTASSHETGDQVDSIYRLQGNSIDLALKLLLSGWGGPCFTGKTISNFIQLGDASLVDNALYFEGISIEREYGVVIGDYITVTGAANGANNFSGRQVVEVTETDQGSYMIVDGAPLVLEVGTSALMAIRSQYDTLPEGIKLYTDEVDVAEHLRLQQLFLNGLDYDFHLTDSIDDAKEFLEQQIYRPGNSYSLPRKAQASVGHFSGPIPGQETVQLDETNIKNPSSLKIRRTITKNFSNEIVYRYEKSLIQEDRYLRGYINQSGTSLAQIPVVGRKLVISADGMREALNAEVQAAVFTDRLLDRFKFGAEFLEGVKVTYGVGYGIEIGDILILDGSELAISDTKEGKRGLTPRLFEVANVSKDFRKGEVVLDLVDTGFDGANRYCLTGPSSLVKNGISQTQLVIEASFYQRYGTAEWKKWQRFVFPSVPSRSCYVRVHDPTFALRDATVQIQKLAGNVVTFQSALGFTPVAGDIMELALYTAPQTEQIKLIYGHMQDAATFGDGKPQYRML